MRRVFLPLIIVICMLPSFCVFAAVAVLPPPQESQKLNPTRPRLSPIVYGDSIQGHRLLRDTEAHPSSHYSHPYLPAMARAIPPLPIPHAFQDTPKRLSLTEAIILALRNNPDVKTAELQRILDKFALEIGIQPYRVQWNALTATGTLQNKSPPSWSAGTGITVDAPTGTKVSLTHANNLLGGAGTNTLTLTQHLLKGFGLAANRVNYQNAVDAERKAQLTFKNSIISTIVTVINDYRSLVKAYNSLKVDKESLKGQENALWQTELQVKAGRMSKADALQQRAFLESTRLSMVQQQEAVRDAYQKFLSELGLVPTAQIKIERTIHLKNTHIPSRDRCIALALAHNISYQQALIELRTDERALITAKDARKWTLDMVSNVTMGTKRSATGSAIASVDTNPTLKFSLSVPIDDISSKKGVVSARIAIEEDKMKLKQQKEDLIRTITNQLDTIENQQEQIRISELNVKLQAQTLQNARIKLKYGKTTIFEINTLESELLSDQVNLIGTKIDYLNDITTLYQAMGMTLDKWNIKLRY